MREVNEMLLALDLTARQATRVLTQAVRLRAKLEIDPRPVFLDTPLWGTLEGREQELLVVQLMETRQELVGASLIGAMCDVRAVLSGQLYLFSTLIADATDNTAPRRLTLAVPEVVQVANRRRFTRRSPIEPIPVRLTVPGARDPFVGNLANISRNGIGCRVAKRELEDLLLIGNEVRVEFVLPWTNHVYSLPAEVCTKNECYDQDHLIIGLEFRADEAAARATLELLRTALDNETQRLTEMDGDIL